MIVGVLNINDALMRVTLTVSPYLDLSNYYTKTQVDALLADIAEIEAANQTPIAITPTIDEDFIIDEWQTTVVEDDPLGRTYAERFGNNIKMITNRYASPLGYATTTAESYVQYNDDETLIESVTFPANVLNIGFLNIL